MGGQRRRIQDGVQHLLGSARKRRSVRKKHISVCGHIEFIVCLSEERKYTVPQGQDKNIVVSVRQVIGAPGFITLYRKFINASDTGNFVVRKVHSAKIGIIPARRRRQHGTEHKLRAGQVEGIGAQIQILAEDLGINVHSGIARQRLGMGFLFIQGRYLNNQGVIVGGPRLHLRIQIGFFGFFHGKQQPVSGTGGEIGHTTIKRYLDGVFRNRHRGGDAGILPLQPDNRVTGRIGGG